MPRFFATALGAALALLAGCGRDSDKDMAEALIRASLVGQGNIQQLELSRQPDNSFAGPLTLRGSDGQVVRLNCTAQRTGTASDANFATTCGQVLDQALLDEIEALLRHALEQQGATVLQIDMARQDDDHATGSAEVRDPSGGIVRMTCSAARQPNGRFNPRCEPAPAGEAPAPAGDGQ